MIYLPILTVILCLLSVVILALVLFFCWLADLFG